MIFKQKIGVVEKQTVLIKRRFRKGKNILQLFRKERSQVKIFIMVISKKLIELMKITSQFTSNYGEISIIKPKFWAKL